MKLTELVKDLNKARTKLNASGSMLSEINIKYQSAYDNALLSSVAPSADRREAEARRFCREKGLEDKQASAKGDFYSAKIDYEVIKETLETYRIIERTKLNGIS